MVACLSTCFLDIALFVKHLLERVLVEVDLATELLGLGLVVMVVRIVMILGVFCYSI